MIPPVEQFSPTATKYEILGIDHDATPEEIKLAFRRVALLYHPDRHGEEEREAADEIFKRITSAYRTLSDPDERRRYNRALSRNEEFSESSHDPLHVPLADILAEIDDFEHMFSSGKLTAINPGLSDLVGTSLIDKLDERIVGVWRMPAAPEGSTHKGTYTAGAVVLTNIRLLLPFLYSWEETKGNTTYRYRGAAMPSVVLPLVQRIVIRSQKRVCHKLRVEIQHSEGTTCFSPAQQNLSKLLLIARFWGISIEAVQEDAWAAELKWALWSPWKTSLIAIAIVMLIAAIAGFFWGSFFYNPVDLANWMFRRGAWQIGFVLLSAWSARRLWSVCAAYRTSDLQSALGTLAGETASSSITIHDASASA